MVKKKKDLTQRAQRSECREHREEKPKKAAQSRSHMEELANGGADMEERREKCS